MPFNDKKSYRKSYYGYNRYERSESRERSEPIAHHSSLIAHQMSAANPSLIAHRLPLSPLMSEESKSTANIQDLSYDFASRCIRLYQYLNEESQYKEYVMSKQLLRSGTSVGANVRESQHPQSDADFLSKLSIAFKEADESSYWIHLLHDNGYISKKAFDSLEQDIQRILRLLTSITKTVKTKLSNIK